MEKTSFFLNNTSGGVNITFKYRYRKQIIIGIIIFLIITISITIPIIMLSNKKGKKKEKPIVLEKKITKKKKTKTKEIEEYKVDIKGQINMPGIYSLKSNSRVIDVITLAGGLTENADTSVINLSKKIKDEMVIIIYSYDEVYNFKQTKEIEKQVEEKCIQKDENALKNDACISSDQVKDIGKVNINSASLEELMILTGIGESKAKDIISYRETNGPFTTIEDLKKVSGIGDSIFAKIKENITA